MCAENSVARVRGGRWDAGMRRFLLGLFFCVTVASGAEEKGFSQSLSEADYKAAGLDKLSDEERARLDELVAAGRVPETPVSKDARPAKPAGIKGRIAGSLSGWQEGAVIVLEDGSRWEVVDKGRYRAAPVRRSPEVEFFPLKNGNYIMVVKTVGRHAEVKRLQAE